HTLILAARSRRPMNLGILEPLRADLQQVEGKMRGALDVYSPTLAELLTYVIDHGGKRLRPALVILASRFYPVEDFERVIAGAAAVELLHTASLVHDDIVDNALLRRGSPTLNLHWGGGTTRSEEHTSELQSLRHPVCRLLP